MDRRSFLRGLPPALLGAVLAGTGCKSSSTARPYHEPPPPDLVPTTIDYTDTDAFDALFEAALVTQDPAILVRTPHQKPDWGGRLNAWIAAWNMGGKVEPPPRTIRGQAPLLAPVTVDGDTIREFRLLIEGLMNRVEDVAGRQSAWWREEKVRSYRVSLLRPYNLRFLMDEARHIQLLFFNGNYAQYYPSFVRAMAEDEGEPEEWSRSFRCLRRLAASGTPAPVLRMTGEEDGEQ
jgi:hypothetical protein